jgi:hypothetical protein
LLRNLLNLLGFLNLVFNFVIFHSGDLSGLGYVIGYFIVHVFSSDDGNIFNSFDGNLFLNGVVNSSGDVFFLVFDSLVFSFSNFFGDSFDI